MRRVTDVPTHSIFWAEYLLKSRVPKPSRVFTKFPYPPLHTIEGRSSARPRPATDHCAPPAYQRAAGQAAGLEATASNESE